MGAGAIELAGIHALNFWQWGTTTKIYRGPLNRNSSALHQHFLSLKRNSLLLAPVGLSLQLITAVLRVLQILTSCVRGHHNMSRPLQVDLWPFDLESGFRVRCDVGYLCANFSLSRPLCSWLRPDVRNK